MSQSQVPLCPPPPPGRSLVVLPASQPQTAAASWQVADAACCILLQLVGGTLLLCTSGAVDQALQHMKEEFATCKQGCCRYHTDSLPLSLCHSLSIYLLLPATYVNTT
jgi:hypothetical protein